MQPGTLLAGKRGLVMGVANDKSIAWGIAEAAAKQGAEIAFSYQMEGFGKRLAPLAESIGSNIMIECDVAKQGAPCLATSHSIMMFDPMDSAKGASLLPNPSI